MKYFALIIGFGLFGMLSCGSLDDADLAGQSVSINLLIQNPSDSGGGVNKAAGGDFSVAKAASSLSVSECTITCSGPSTSSQTVSVPSGATSIQATIDCPAASGYEICAECLDTSKTSNNVTPGFRGCLNDVTLAGSDALSLATLYLNQASRSSGDFRYCRFRQDTSAKVTLVCGANGELTDAQKTTAECHIEIDSDRSDASPQTVDSSSDGFVSGTKGNPYFVLGPGLINPVCHFFNADGSRRFSGTGSWGAVENNTTLDCSFGVRQAESILAAGRHARFAASCTMDGSTWYLSPASGMAVYKLDGAQDGDVASLTANGGSCDTTNAGRTCNSGFCAASGECAAVSAPALAADVTDLTGSGCNGACGTGSTNGAAADARFNSLNAHCISPNGNTIYGMDADNHVIRKIDLTAAATSSSYVTTYCGTAGSSGSTNGACSAALFNAPGSCVVNQAGTYLFVVEPTQHDIRQIDLTTNTVTLFAGSAGTSGFVNGTGSDCRFNGPAGPSIDADGTLYLADENNHAIRKITAAAVCTTLAGQTASGSADGTGTAASFNGPRGTAIDSTGTFLYVNDRGNGSIRKINTATQAVTTLVDGTLANVTGISIDPTGMNLYLTDEHRIRKVVVETGAVSILAGTASTGADNGNGSSATFNQPGRVVPDPAGTTLYVSDQNNNKFRKVE